MTDITITNASAVVKRVIETHYPETSSISNATSFGPFNVLFGVSRINVRFNDFETTTFYRLELVKYPEYLEWWTALYGENGYT